MKDEYGEIIELIMPMYKDKITTIDLTASSGELVRCKDCKHYRYYGLSQDTVSECTIDICENPAKDWFCAEGERES